MKIPKNQILYSANRKALKKFPDNCIDAIVTDPPYLLDFMGKDWDKVDSKLSGLAKQKAMQEWHDKWAVEALRVAKPGAYLLAFGGTRTFHRMACAIEDAGWEIRDCIMWVYGKGFPKSHNVSKAIDKAAGAEGKRGPIKRGGERLAQLTNGKRDGEGRWGNESGRDPYTYIPSHPIAKQWDGWGTALKPAWEPVIVARKPLEGTVAQNVLKWGVGALNIDSCRVPIDATIDDPRLGGKGSWGTASAAKNVYEGGYAGVRVTSSPLGRWPANVVHDGSEEVVGMFPESKAGTTGKPSIPNNPIKMQASSTVNHIGHNDSGSAARFFYTAKASKSERWFYCKDCKQAFHSSKQKEHWHKHKDENGKKSWNHLIQHPTVKPLSLMKYLVRLVTPPKGLVLDLFCGTGTTCLAAKQQGFRYIGIDKKRSYCEISRKRLENQKSTLFG